MTLFAVLFGFGLIAILHIAARSSGKLAVSGFACCPKCSALYEPDNNDADRSVLQLACPYCSTEFEYTVIQ